MQPIDGSSTFVCYSYLILQLSKLNTYVSATCICCSADTQVSGTELVDPPVEWLPAQRHEVTPHHLPNPSDDITEVTVCKTQVSVWFFTSMFRLFLFCHWKYYMMKEDAVCNSEDIWPWKISVEDKKRCNIFLFNGNGTSQGLGSKNDTENMLNAFHPQKTTTKWTNRVKESSNYCKIYLTTKVFWCFLLKKTRSRIMLVFSMPWL